MEYFIILKSKAFRYIKWYGRKFLMIFIFTGLTWILILSGIRYAKEKRLKEGISESVFRFHVIANSDSEEDQEIKIKVKESILNYLNNEIVNLDNLDDTISFLKSEQENIKNIAQNELEDSGFYYGAEVFMVHELFPKRTYGDLTMPAGEYDALKIVLGDGEGENFWCVLFPPLCYVDASLCEVSEETKDDFKHVLSAEEYEIIVNDGKLKPEFKVLEAIDNIFK